MAAVAAPYQPLIKRRKKNIYAEKMLENLMQNNQFHTKHASRNYHIASWVINYSKPHPAWRYPYPSNPISPFHSTTVLDLSLDDLLLCVFTPGWSPIQQTRLWLEFSLVVTPIIQGVFFFTGTPLKSSKYKKVNLG